MLNLNKIKKNGSKMNLIKRKLKKLQRKNLQITMFLNFIFDYA
jgi:hypothetical protein